LAVHPESWAAKLPQLFPTHEVEKIDRYHYLCRNLKFDWRKNVAADYYYHLAASAWALLGNQENAAKYLQAALDQGWSDFARTIAQEEFVLLHEAPIWKEILAQNDSAVTNEQLSIHRWEHIEDSKINPI
jgi:hypothetical protein